MSYTQNTNPQDPQTYSNAGALAFLSELDLRISGHVPLDEETDYMACFAALDALLRQMLNVAEPQLHKPAEDETAPVSALPAGDLTVSLNVTKLLAKTLVSVFEKLPSKVYDTANFLLGSLSAAENGTLSRHGQIACVVLVDLFESHPIQVSSLINFAATSIYKILKKTPDLDSSLVYLLGVVVRAASRSDIDDKLSAKLAKLAQKALLQSQISVGGSDATGAEPSKDASITCTTHCVVLLKELLIFQVAANYSALLEHSASASSGSKMKPEAIMNSQHAFQQSLLSAHEKVFVLGLQSQFAEVRAATVDLLAHVLIRFVDADKFSATEYLLEMYPMPHTNAWDASLTHKSGDEAEAGAEHKNERNSLASHDSESIVSANLGSQLLQIGVAETFVAYVQLQSLQEKDFLAASLTGTLDAILLKFDDMHDPSHIQNDAWVKTVAQWTRVVQFLVDESGSSAHDTLARYVVDHFSASQEEASRAGSPEVRGTGSGKGAKQSGLFRFAAMKKAKKKGAARGSVNLYTNPYQAKLVLDIVACLVPYGVDFDSLVHTKSGEPLDDSAEVAAAEDDRAMDEDENRFTTKRNSYVSSVLISLLANSSEYIRSYGLACLLQYARVYTSESNRLTLEIFALVAQSFNSQGQSQSQTAKESPTSASDRNITKSAGVRLIAYALALSALVKQTDFVMLQNSTVAKLLSFCTQNLKHSSAGGSKHTRNGACWLVLAALVTFYHESEFVKLNSSQLLVFWKNLLTAQFVSGGLSADAGVDDREELVQNLKLRTFSLFCLLNYVSTVQATPELLKQLQFLLVKSHKYLVYLESNLAEIGLVTSFSPQAFNESEYNPNLVNSFLFSNNFEKSQLATDNQLISLILYNKKIVLQGFIKTASLLKGDINSSLVVLLLKIFADAKLFSRFSSVDHAKDKSKGAKSKSALAKAVHRDHDLLYLGEDYNYHFGVTSKFTALASKNNDFNGDGVAESEGGTWTDVFEQMQASASSQNLSFDPAVLVLQDYYAGQECSTSLVTSLVDLSIELFQLVFPGLSYNIQLSLLDQLRSAFNAKNADPLRQKALGINVSIALHGVLKQFAREKIALSENLVLLFIDILNLVESTNIALVSLGADSVGLAASLLTKAKSEELVSSIIGKIVSSTSPFYRGRHVLSLARINHYNHICFLEIHDVITQLTKDTHPVMSYYSLSAAAILFQNPLGNQSLIEEVVEYLHSNLLSDCYGLLYSNNAYANFRSKYGLTSAVATLLKVCITSLGPRVKECSETLKAKIFQILLILSHGIGCADMTELLASVSTVLMACRELIVFEPGLTAGFPAWFESFALSVIRSNLKTGVGIIKPTSLSFAAVFPFTTGKGLRQAALLSMLEMTKIGVQTLSKHSLSLAWISMELRPCSDLEALINCWVDANPEAEWFHQLTRLFNISSRKLVGKFLETSYQQKLLPLQQRYKKVAKDASVIFEDEEAQNIVEGEGDTEDKIQPINWALRSLIYDLLIRYLSENEKKIASVAGLEPKIQEIVRISFLGTTAPVVSTKLRGVRLLDNALKAFGHLEDPLYPGVSILEQQQAQIISALIPCFSSDSDASVMVEAIGVSSRFINLPRINFYSKQRILKTMIYLLEEISSGKFLKFVHLESMAEYGRKAIQLAILNCWAVLNVNHMGHSADAEPEFDEILKKYANLLTSSWILALKDLSNLKYNQPNSKELKLYDDYWLNFVGVLSLTLEQNPVVINDFLRDEEDSFFFVMFCQCAEALIKNQHVAEVLGSVKILVKVPSLAKSLFEASFFGEVIELLDRLVLMEKDAATKLQVVDTISTLFESFCQLEEQFSGSADKLFELLRVAMLPLFDIFPFLRQDFSAEDPASVAVLKKCTSSESLAMAGKQFAVLSQMVPKFPESSKSDVVACMLYLVAKLFEHGDDILMGVALPFLKVVVSQAKTVAAKLLDPFMRVLTTHGLFGSRLSDKNVLIALVILVTVGDVQLDAPEIGSVVETLIQGLSDKALAPTSIQLIKSVVGHTGPGHETSTKMAKLILKSVLESLTDGSEQGEVATKIQFEIVYIYAGSPAAATDESATALLSLVIPLLIALDEKRVVDKAYLHGKMTGLMNSRTSSFRKVVKDLLDDNQRRTAQNLLQYSTASVSEHAPEAIQLKSFT